MTKAELKRLETEKKHDFIARAYAIVLSCIPEQTVMLRNSVQIRLTHQSYNRYIRFHKYDKDMNIQIFGDGNVVIVLNTISHNEYKEQLFEYSGEEEQQETFLAELKELISRLLPLFTDQDLCDFHTYMGYVGGGRTAAEAYQQMMDHYHRFQKEK